MDRDTILPIKALANWTKFLVAVALLSAWAPGQLCLRLCIIFWKWRPYGEYQRKFNKFIKEMMAKFYHELEGETEGLHELDDWEPQRGNKPRGYIPREGVAGTNSFNSAEIRKLSNKPFG